MKIDIKYVYLLLKKYIDDYNKTLEKTKEISNTTIDFLQKKLTYDERLFKTEDEWERITNDLLANISKVIFSKKNESDDGYFSDEDEETFFKFVLERLADFKYNNSLIQEIRKKYETFSNECRKKIKPVEKILKEFDSDTGSLENKLTIEQINFLNENIFSYMYKDPIRKYEVLSVLLQSNKKIFERQQQHHQAEVEAHHRESRMSKLQQMLDAMPELLPSFKEEEEQLLNEARSIVLKEADLLEIKNDSKILEAIEIIFENKIEDDIYFDFYDVALNFAILIPSLKILIDKIEKRENIEFNFKILKSAIEYYKLNLQEYKNITIENQKKEKFDEENIDILSKVIDLVDIFNEINNGLSTNERNLLVTIQEFILANKTDVDTINSICANSNKINYQFYIEYNILSKIKQKYEEYLKQDNLATRTVYLQFFKNLLKNYEAAIPKEEIVEEVEENTNEIVHKNPILYLCDENNIPVFESYVEGDNSTDYKDIHLMFKLMDKIALSSPNFLIMDSDVLKNNSNVNCYKSKARRIKAGTYRVAYINLKSIINQDLPEEFRHLYIVLNAGYKTGEFSIYEYTNQRKVYSKFNELLDEIETEVTKIYKMPITKEEKNIRIKNYLNDLISSNNKIYLESKSRLLEKYDISNQKTGRK